MLPGDLNLVSTYISELAPARMRGRIAVRTFLIDILGQTATTGGIVSPC